MEQAIHHLSTPNQAKNAVEIVVHVSDNLEDEQRKTLIAALEQQDGIVSAEFCPSRYHLMLLRYDRERYSSQDVLGVIRGQKLQARLIGPI